jgi:hypothetical protein
MTPTGNDSPAHSACTMLWCACIPRRALVLLQAHQEQGGASGTAAPRGFRLCLPWSATGTHRSIRRTAGGRQSARSPEQRSPATTSAPGTPLPRPARSCPVRPVSPADMLYLLWEHTQMRATTNEQTKISDRARGHAAANLHAPLSTRSTRSTRPALPDCAPPCLLLAPAEDPA